MLHLGSRTIFQRRESVLRGLVALALGVAGGACFLPGQAAAVPSFAAQTGQPCAACHVGAFGPQLKQFGRDFKLYGYTSTDNQPRAQWIPPVTMITQNAFTHTNGNFPGDVTHVGPNDNFTLDEVDILYAGRILPHLGAYVEVTYDGVGGGAGWNNSDIRFAREGSLFGEDIVWGITANNSPTVSDVWNSTPTWGFPFAHSNAVTGPAASTLIDGGVQWQVAGAGAYMMWNDLIYVEIDGYKGLGRDVRRAVGADRTNSMDGVSPYWRLAVQQTFDDDRHYVQVGTYGIRGEIFPGGDTSTGTDKFTDIAFDANYQWIPEPKKVTSDVLSAHATYIREDQNLEASSILAGTNRHDVLETFRVDATYSIDATFSPMVQYFQTRGSNDNQQWYGGNGVSGSPNTTGFVFELDYTPWGKPDSPVNWANARIGVQYTAYTDFNGSSAHASDHNVFLINLWTALAFNR